MHIEVSVAVNFVVSYLYGKLPRRRVHMLGEELDRGIRAKCIGHWYPEQPLKGTAYRSVNVSGDHPDPLVLQAAREIGLEVGEIFQHLPDGLTLWVDPGEVSCRIGEKGACTVLYSERSHQQHQQHSDLEPQMPPTPQPAAGTSTTTADVASTTITSSSSGGGGCSDFNPEAADFIPLGGLAENFVHLAIGQPSPPVELSSYLLQKSSSAPNFFTAAAFAQTKFGSTKLRQQTRRPNRLHGGGGGGSGFGGESAGGRRTRQSQLQPPPSTLADAAFNRSFSLSPGAAADCWSTGLTGGPSGGGAADGNLLSVHIPAAAEFYQHQHQHQHQYQHQYQHQQYQTSNGSSRQASPGGGGGVSGSGAAARVPERLLLAK